jgi:hypothetical protein
MMKQVLGTIFAPKTQKVGAGEALVTTGGRELYRNADKFITAAPGASVLNPNTGLPVFRNDPKEVVAPAGSTVLKDGVPIHTTPRELSATDKKAIFDAENDLPAIDDTLSKLRRAQDLNAKVKTGFLIKQRAEIANKAGMANDQDKATLEWLRMMEPAAIKEMSSTLKGASTDREMLKYLEIIADPSQPADVRARIIEKAITLAESSKKIATDRMNQLRAGSYYGREGGASAGGGAPRVPDPLGLR